MYLILRMFYDNTFNTKLLANSNSPISMVLPYGAIKVNVIRETLLSHIVRKLPCDFIVINIGQIVILEQFTVYIYNEW